MSEERDRTIATDSEAGAVRDTLRYVLEHRNHNLLVVPLKAGAIREKDVSTLLEDLACIASTGMKVILGKPEGDAMWSKLTQYCRYSTESLSADDPAEAIAQATLSRGIHKLCLLCNADAVYSSEGRISSLSVKEATQVLHDGNVKGDGAYALRLALDVCRKGISRVHLVNAHRPGSLLVELYTGHGSGTMIYADDRYKSTRAANAGDLRSLSALSPELFGNATSEHAREMLKSFRVFTVDDEVHGCAKIEHGGDHAIVTHLLHSERFNAAEVLECLLEAAMLEAKAMNGVNGMTIPLDDIAPLMSIQPWFHRLGFEKKTAQIGPGRQQAWVCTL